MNTFVSRFKTPVFSPHLAVSLLAAMVAVTSYYACDLEIAQYFHAKQLPGELRRLVASAEVFAFGGGVMCIILTAAVLDRRGWKLGVWLAANALGAGIAADIIKLTIARLRPRGADLTGTIADTWGTWMPILHKPANYGSVWQSFPSAHTATAWGLAVALSVCYPRGRWLFVGFAVLASLQRLQDQAHFLSDVLAGAAAGLLWSWLLGLSERLTSLRDQPAEPHPAASTPAT